MAVYLDPTKPWFGVDFLTWKPPPLPVLECDGCGWASDRCSVILIPIFQSAGPMIVCSACRCRPGKDLSACFEISLALRWGELS